MVQNLLRASNCGLLVAHDGIVVDGSVTPFYIVAKRLGYENARLERAPWADDDPNLYPEKQVDSPALP